jgi:hypothetical protein
MYIVALGLGCGTYGLKDEGAADTALESWQGNGDWRDESEGDADTDSDTDADADGVGGVVDFLYNVTACPECFGMSAAEQVQVTVAVRFHAAAAGSWVDWLPPQGSCERDLSITAPSTDGLDVGGSIILQGGGDSWTLVRDSSTGTTTYRSVDMAMTDWVNGQSYDLSLPDTGDTVEGAITAGLGFDALEPIGMLNTTTSTAYREQISAEAATFSWAPAGVGDGVMIIVAGFSSDGAESRGTISCWAADTGSFTIPAEAFYSPTPWADLDLLQIYVHRYTLGAAISPLDGSLIEGIAKKGVVGTAVLRP